MMKIAKNLSLLTSALVLASCSSHDHLPPQQSIRLPMIFQVEEFVDTRIADSHHSLADAVDTREKFGLNKDMFLKKLVRSINHRNLYQYEPGLLRIRLKDYAAVKDNNLQTVSFYVDMTGLDSDGNVLASGLFSCLASDKHVIDVRDTFERMFDTTGEGRWKDSKQMMWEDLYQQCLYDLALQFKEKVIYLHRGRS